MGRTLSPEKKLQHRVMREFQKRKLIGDILIDNDEYVLLIRHLKTQFQNMYHSGVHEIVDPLVCVALVQIGIRFYDGRFWPHVEQELGCREFNSNHQGWLGNSFIKTMQQYRKLELGYHERVNSILMHGFVSDTYSENFFNFLYAFYQVDLERDLSRLDRNTMSDLIDIIKCNDNTDRTYYLVEHTADAVRNNPRGAKTRIRRFIKLIDRAFWGDSLPETSQNRLTVQFMQWQRTSDLLNRDRGCQGGSKSRGQKSFSSPYLFFDPKKNVFELRIPSQMIRFQDVQELSWKVSIHDQTKMIEINPYRQGVTGYKTEPEVEPLAEKDILSDICVTLMKGEKPLRQFEIKAEKIRFFDGNGNSVKTDCLTPGEACSFSEEAFIPRSGAITDTSHMGTLIQTFYTFVEGDLVCLPDGEPLSVGGKIKEGLLPRGKVEKCCAYVDERLTDIYKTVPTIIIKTKSSRIEGTAISVNGKQQHLDLSCVTAFSLYDRSGETGYLVELKHLLACDDGYYDISIDIPNDHAAHNWRFVLINDMQYEFEDAPYIFTTRGTLTIPDFLPLQPVDGMRMHLDGIKRYLNFDLVPGQNQLYLNFGDIPIAFEIPCLSYQFEQEEWKIARHEDIWHEEFEPKLYLKYPGDKITFYLDDEEEDDEEHTETFYKIKEKDLFECDLNRFSSWFGRSLTRRQIFMELPDINQQKRFLGVVTKSILESGILEGDFEKGRLIGEFKIIGKADYYGDLLFNGCLIADKIPLTNGLLVLNSDLPSGMYEAIIYEKEEDDFSFDDAEYYEIGRRSLELLNPLDLNGKNISVTAIKQAGESNFTLPLHYQYDVIELRSADPSDHHNYRGTMLVRRSNGELMATFPVNAEFFDLKKLYAVYLTFIDDDECIEFLYDELDRSIVKKENSRLTKAQAYRRYRYSLYPEDYIFKVKFIENSWDGTAVDDTEYNNLAKHEQTPSLHERMKWKNEIEKVSIQNMKLSTRAFNVLNRAAIRNSDQISTLSLHALLQIRNAGWKVAVELIDKMRTLGYEDWALQIEAERKAYLLKSYSARREQSEQRKAAEKPPVPTENETQPAETEKTKQKEVIPEETETTIRKPLLLEETTLSAMTYTCLKRAGIKTVEQLKRLVVSKGAKGLNNIPDLHKNMREEIIDFIMFN